MVRPSTAPSYEASCPRSYTPPKNGFPLGDALQFAPGALLLHPPPFLPVEEQQLPMGAPHQAPPPPPGAEKTLTCVKSPAPIVSGTGDRGFPARGFHAHAPPPPVPPGPPLPLVADAVPQHAPECPQQRDVSHTRARKQGGIGGVHAVQRPLRPGEGQHQALVGPGEAPGMVCLPPATRGSQPKPPPPPLPPPPPMPRPRPRPSPPRCLRGLLLLHPPPPAASFFFFFSSLFFSFFLFFSSFFFSFFLLFLSCSEESVDSSLEVWAAGREG